VKFTMLSKIITKLTVAFEAVKLLISLVYKHSLAVVATQKD